jgi:hypothetical protein
VPLLASSLCYSYACLAFSRRHCYRQVIVAEHKLPGRTSMPAAVKIKTGKYGTAIRLLLERGGVFQTRYQRTLIVNAEQRAVLEEAGLVVTNGLDEQSGKKHGHKKDAG